MAKACLSAVADASEKGRPEDRPNRTDAVHDAPLGVLCATWNEFSHLAGNHSQKEDEPLIARSEPVGREPEVPTPRVAVATSVRCVQESDCGPGSL